MFLSKPGKVALIRSTTHFNNAKLACQRKNFPIRRSNFTVLFSSQKKTRYGSIGRQAKEPESESGFREKKAEIAWEITIILLRRLCQIRQEECC